MPATVRITSFGHLHGAAPAAHLAVDLRPHFRDPAGAPHLRHLSAHDQAVRDHVLATPGITALVHALAAAAAAHLAGPGEHDVDLALGCAGGIHRAPTVAGMVADLLHDQGHRVQLTHRDLHRAAAATAADSEFEDGDGAVSIDDPIEMPTGADDFELPPTLRSAAPASQARARLEALVEAWGAVEEAFTAPQAAQALADQHGLTRSRQWVLKELRRLEADGLLELDDRGRWHPAA